MSAHSNRGGDDRPQGIAGTGGRPQQGRKPKQAPVSQRNASDEAGLDVEREGVEALAASASEADRGQRSPLVLGRVEERGQIPGHHPQPGRMSGSEKTS